MLYEVSNWLRQATFHLADEGGTPVLVVEIASPGTRDNTLGIKRAFYYQAGMQKYIIVDRGPEGEDPVQLMGYQRGPRGWLPLPVHRGFEEAQSCACIKPQEQLDAQGADASDTGVQQGLVFQCVICDDRTYRLVKIRSLVRATARDAWREVSENREK